MVEINLISWRTQKRAYEDKMMRQIVAGCAALALLVMMTAHIILRASVKYYGKQLHALAAVMPRPTTRAGVQTASPAAELTQLLDAVQAISSGVCYQRIANDGSGWMIEGRATTAESMLSGLQLFEKISTSYDTSLREFKKDQIHDGYQFIVKMGTAEREQGE